MQNKTGFFGDLVEQGYCVVPSILPKRLVDKACKTIDALVLQQTDEEIRAYKSLGTLISTWRTPFFIDLISYPAVLHILSVLGFSSHRFSSGYVFQKPSKSPPTFWHQDWWLWNDPASYTPFIHQIGLMYYLTDTYVENGSLRVIPGSHRIHHQLHSVLETANVQELRRAEHVDSPLYQSMKEEVSVPVRAGDLIIMDARLLHGAYANITDTARTLVNCWYFPTYLELSEGVRSAIGSTKLPKDWSEEETSRIKPYLPEYKGEVLPLPRCLHPNKQLLLTKVNDMSRR